MNSSRTVLATALAIAAGFAAGMALSARSAQAPATGGETSASFPKDVHADTGNRLAALKRDDLNDEGKKLFDARGPNGDAFGPAAIRLYSLPVAETMGEVNSYLRYKSGLDPRLVQLAILVAARESDSEYEWTAHEPQALKAGLQPEIVDIVKYRKPTAGLAEKDAALIEWGRQVLVKHHVDSATYAHARALFGDKGMVDFAALIGDYTATAILLNTFDQHIRPADKPLLPIP